MIGRRLGENMRSAEYVDIGFEITIGNVNEPLRIGGGFLTIVRSFLDDRCNRYHPPLPDRYVQRPSRPIRWPLSTSARRSLKLSKESNENCQGDQDPE